MSARGELQREVAVELESMGLSADTALGQVEGRSGYSRDVYFEDVSLGFSGRLRIFGEEFVTLSIGKSATERYDSVDDAVTAIATAYAFSRDRAPVAVVEAAVSLPAATAGSPQARVSQDDVEAVRGFLLRQAKAATKPEDRKQFAAQAVRLGATASEVLELVL